MRSQCVGGVTGGCTGGFTLIEVLIAVVVLAIGVIGASGAQLAALRMRHGTSLMSDGMQLASALADRMRANPEQMRGGDALNPYAQLNYDAALDGAPPAAPVSCFGDASCTSAAMAQFDLAEVRAALHRQFPGGRIAVCRDAAIVAAGGSGLTWACAGAAGGAADAPLVIKLGWRGKQADGADDADAAGSFAPALAIVVAGL